MENKDDFSYTPLLLLDRQRSREIIVYIQYQSVCPQSIQNARLSVQSSELGPLTPFPASECVSTLDPQGGATQGEGVGGPNSDDYQKAWHYDVCILRGQRGLVPFCFKFPVKMLFFFLNKTTPFDRKTWK